MEEDSKKVAESTERAAETMGNTIVDVIDKLAGKKSDLKLTFKDLSLDTGMFQAKLNGAIVLDVIVAQEAENANPNA